MISMHGILSGDSALEKNKAGKGIGNVRIPKAINRVSWERLRR